MSTKKSKKNFKKFEEKIKCCGNCDNCIYIGEGDYLCDANMVVVMEDHFPNDNYNYCNECDWVDIDYEEDGDDE